MVRSVHVAHAALAVHRQLPVWNKTGVQTRRSTVNNNNKNNTSGSHSPHTTGQDKTHASVILCEKCECWIPSPSCQRHIPMQCTREFIETPPRHRHPALWNIPIIEAYVTSTQRSPKPRATAESKASGSRVKVRSLKDGPHERVEDRAQQSADCPKQNQGELRRRGR